jgi:general secretion pathway protein D
MKMRPHCFLRPILRPAAVFALAFGVTSLMLSAQDEDAALDADAAVMETAEEAVPDSGDNDAETVIEADVETDVETDGEAVDESGDEDAVDEEAEEEPVLSGDELDVTNAAEADMIENEAYFNELLAQAITRRDEKEFEAAFKLFDEAKKAIEKCEVSPAKDAFAKRLSEERKKAQVLYGNSLLEECEKNFNKLLLLNHTDEILEIGQKLLTDLAYANAVYYLGVLPGEPYDNADLQVAIAKDPVKKDQFAATVESMRKSTQERIDSQNYWNETSLDAVDPRYNERQREINLLFRAGQFLYQNDQWDEARDKMEQILVKDPYNEDAVTLLEKIYRRLYAIADVRSYNEFLREQAQSDWSWVESIPDVRNIVITGGADTYDSAGNELYNRLNELMIDHIEFNDSDIGSVITLLRARSKDLDPLGEGFNIIVPQAEKYANKLVTLNLDQIPLYEVIRYICKITGLSFRIDEKYKTITIGSGSDVSDMTTRFIPIRQATILRIVGNMRAEGIGDGITQEDTIGGGESVGSLITLSGSASDPDSQRVTSIAPETLRTYFAESGIPFEEGSSIAYDARANKLTVVNTPENIRQLEFAIRDMDMQDPLILIESKMVEIKMNDLEELGFDWTLTHTNGPDDHTTYTFTAPSISSGFSDNTLVNNLNLLPNFGPGGSWSLFLTINAIDRTDRSEILSTPKVVTVSGREAQVQMVRQMYFPESWTEPEISTSCGSSVTFEPSYPEFGGPRDIGTSLVVTPTLQANNYTIRLELNPSVTDLTGWSDYSYNYVIGEFASGEEYPMTLKMPEISNREIQTTIKVYDGQTVVIGGILSDTHGALSDRWPMLADIPLLGRLFTESASEAHKDNLIISVSTRLISGDGIPVRTNTQNGLPDFRR